MQLKSRVYIDDPSLYPDHFDSIPGSIVLLILNKLEDVRSLGRCAAVSKRFNSLVPLVNDVYVKIDRVVTVDGDADESSNPSSPKSRNLFSHFFKLFLLNILKPFNHLRNTNTVNRPLLPQLLKHDQSYGGDPLEEGEKDYIRGQEFKYCMHKYDTFHGFI